MTDLQLVVLSASIMKANKTGTSASASDLIDNAQKLLLEAYKREITHKNHLQPKDTCFNCQMNVLLTEAQKSGPRVLPS